MDYNFAKQLIKVLPSGLIPTGSYVRRENPHDLDFLTYDKFDDILKRMKFDYKIISQGKKYIALKILDGIELNIWLVNPNNIIYQKLAHDYKKYIPIAMRKKAKAMGYKLSQNGFYDNNGNMIMINDIADIFDILGIHFRYPWQK